MSGKHNMFDINKLRKAVEAHLDRLVSDKEWNEMSDEIYDAVVNVVDFYAMLSDSGFDDIEIEDSYDE